MSEQACTWEKMFLAIETVVNISQIIRTVVTLRCIIKCLSLFYMLPTVSVISATAFQVSWCSDPLLKCCEGKNYFCHVRSKLVGATCPHCLHASTTSEAWFVIQCHHDLQKNSTICIVHLSKGILIFAAFFCQMLPVSEVCRLSVKLVPR